jgi:hypothetical protein
MALEDILSIVLRSCPGTALVRMNFGWSVLDSYFSHPFFLSRLSFQTPARLNLVGKILAIIFGVVTFLNFTMSSLGLTLWDSWEPTAT